VCLTRIDRTFQSTHTRTTGHTLLPYTLHDRHHHFSPTVNVLRLILSTITYVLYAHSGRGWRMDMSQVQLHPSGKILFMCSHPLLLVVWCRFLFSMVCPLYWKVCTEGHSWRVLCRRDALEFRIEWGWITSSLRGRFNAEGRTNHKKGGKTMHGRAIGVRKWRVRRTPGCLCWTGLPRGRTMSHVKKLSFQAQRRWRDSALVKHASHPIPSVSCTANSERFHHNLELHTATIAPVNWN